MTDKTALARYRAALAALHANQEKEQAAGITHETPEYLRLNREVNEAAQGIPQWLQ